MYCALSLFNVTIVVFFCIQFLIPTLVIIHYYLDHCALSFTMHESSFLLLTRLCFSSRDSRISLQLEISYMAQAAMTGYRTGAGGPVQQWLEWRAGAGAGGLENRHTDRNSPPGVPGPGRHPAGQDGPTACASRGLQVQVFHWQFQPAVQRLSVCRKQSIIVMHFKLSWSDSKCFILYGRCRCVWSSSPCAAAAEHLKDGMCFKTNILCYIQPGNNHYKIK